MVDVDQTAWDPNSLPDPLPAHWEREKSRSAFSVQRSSFPHAFTLTEMLATVAVLVILFGVMVDLAKHVRNRSAGELTRRLLADLDQALERYRARNGNLFPQVRLLIAANQPEWPSDELLRIRAQVNSGDWVRSLRTSGELGERMFGGLPLAIYDATHVRDAWGSPIVMMPKGRSDIGMAPGDNPFFLSAGPDRSYRTREDNLYSYEVAVSK